ncbi:MAG: hypothetical protein WKF82_00545 [Nocardioidaceae bacterium]
MSASARGHPARTKSAEDFGVKPAQIVKDLNVLWFCGLPNAVTGEMIDIDMDALKGQGVIRLSNAEFLTRPLRLAPHEALALTVALRVLLETSGAERQTVERTLRKIESAAGRWRRAPPLWMSTSTRSIPQLAPQSRQALHEPTSAGPDLLRPRPRRDHSSGWSTRCG